jgi:hypothetical protein
MKVSVYDLNDLNTPAGESPDVLLGWAVTDDNGNWHIDNILDADTGYNDPTQPDVYVIYETTNEAQGAPLRTVRSNNNTLYRWDTKGSPQWDWQPGTPSYDRPFDTNEANIDAVWLFDDANRAHDYVLQQTGQEPGQLHVYWATGLLDFNGCTSSCFGPLQGSPNGYGAFVQDLRPAMPDVAVHEFGHAYRFNLTGLWASNCTQGHATWMTTNSQCAWEEGWADFLPTVVNNDVCYDDNSTVGPCAIAASNLEDPTWGDNRPTGSEVEGRVAGTLLDMHDYLGFPTFASNEGWDNANGYGFWRTWTILNPSTESNQELTLIDFWTHWNVYSDFATASSMSGPLYQNTIVTHTFLPYLENNPGTP